jgi:hypothetical protein
MTRECFLSVGPSVWHPMRYCPFLHKVHKFRAFIQSSPVPSRSFTKSEYEFSFFNNNYKISYSVIWRSLRSKERALYGERPSLLSAIFFRSVYSMATWSAFSWKSANWKSYISNFRKCIAVWPFDISWRISAKFCIRDGQVTLLAICEFCEYYRRECWVGNTDGKKPQRRHGRTWCDNSNMDTKDVGCRKWGALIQFV